MQSTVVSDGNKVVFDWTFQALKNFNFPGVKAIFTVFNGRTKEILFLTAIPSTTASNISHPLNQVIEKWLFQPRLVYTNTCLNNDTFWEQTFGNNVITKLGLFHLMHWIVDILDTHMGELYWKAIVQLKDCMYTYHQDDEANLIQALKNRHLRNQKHTQIEIHQLKDSKHCNQRYSKYLHKKLLPGEIVCNRLTGWLEKFKDAQDNRGRSIFTKRT